MTNQKFKKKLDDLLLTCQKNLSRVDEDLIRRAFEFGFNAHRHDMRASGEPFFDHPYEVARILAKEMPLDDISVAAALLHDVAEDTDYQIKDVRAEFGDTIADIVDGATKISDIFKSHDLTQAQSYGKMLLSMVNDIRVMLVKFADRLHNMRTLEYLPPDKQRRMARETRDLRPLRAPLRSRQHQVGARGPVLQAPPPRFVRHDRRRATGVRLARSPPA